MFRIFQTSTKASSVFRRNNPKPTYLLRAEEDKISDTIIKTGEWEPQVIGKAKQFLKPDSNVLDLGANIGAWSLELSKFCPQGHIYAFEPQPETFHQMCGNLFINNIQNVTAYQYAVGRKDQVKTSSKPPNNAQSGQVAYMHINPINNGGSAIDDKGTIPVEIKAIDDFQFPKIDLIKLDVEGYEINAMEGAVELLNRDRPVVFFEAWPNKVEENTKWFVDHGYDVYHLSLDDFYAIPRQDWIPPPKAAESVPKKSLCGDSNQALLIAGWTVFGVAVALLLAGAGIMTWQLIDTSKSKRRNYDM